MRNFPEETPLQYQLYILEILNLKSFHFVGWVQMKRAVSMLVQTKNNWSLWIGDLALWSVSLETHRLIFCFDFQNWKSFTMGLFWQYEPLSKISIFTAGVKTCRANRILQTSCLLLFYLCLRLWPFLSEYLLVKVVEGCRP